MGAAAIIMAPVALAAPASAAMILNEANADDAVATVQGPNGTNQESFWVGYLSDRDIDGASCKKVTPASEIKSWVIPAPATGTQYALVTSKAGNENALEEGQYPNQVWWAPKAAQGNTVTAVAGKNISHVILCTVPKKTTTPPPRTSPPVTKPPVTKPPVTKPPVTGPVVETDRVADTGSVPRAWVWQPPPPSSPLELGALAFSRRRQGNHR
jgi:hypothetical protein